MDNYHFIGIGGIGMSALAHILKDQGHNVSGSDEKSSFITKKLKDKGIKVFSEHNHTNIPEGSTVIYSSGIGSENPELRFSRLQKLPIKHRSELLSQLLKGYKSILIAGSHGKTTSAALLVSVLKVARLPLTFAVGGLISELNGQHVPFSETFVAEADESDGSLTNYFPTGSIITNVDNEHLDYYDSIENLYKAFNIYVDQVKEEKLLFYNGDEDLLIKIPALKKGISFGFSEICDLQILSFSQKKWKSIFSIRFKEKIFSNIVLSLTGKHNILNAASVFGMALNLGITEKDIRFGLETFVGVKRRLEKKRDDKSLLTIDDYAHHPREIYLTLQGLRRAVGHRRVIAICQPHRYSRVKICQKEYAHAFVYADIILITDIYSPKEKDQWINCISPNDLVKDIKEKTNQNVFYVPFFEIEEFLRKILYVHDVVISLGAGNINKIHNLLSNIVPKKLNVALVFGGQSCEHTISLLSSRFFDSCLDKNLYNVSYFGINKEGKWITGLRAKELLEDTKLLEIPLNEGNIITNSLVINEMQEVSIFCPILHGPYGEDGIIQGFFETINKPYSGPNVCFGAVSMDKVLSKRIVKSMGISVIPWLDFTEEEWLYDSDGIIKLILDTFSFPIFVKASHLGSSLGVFLVNGNIELKEALRKAFLYDHQVIVEESRLGSREIEFSILGNAKSPFIIESYPSERLGKGTFIDYFRKYGLEGQNSILSSCNPELDLEIISEGLSLSRKIYAAMGGKGCARIDFFLDHNENFWFSEINPIPGMTSTSPFPLSLETRGLSCKEMCHELIITGLYNHREKEKKKAQTCI